jgi:hypothetical protein
MRIAFINPFRHLEDLPWDRYDLILAQYMTYDNPYSRYYSRRSLETPHSRTDDYLILDNGAAERGTLSGPQILQIASRARPDCIVCPDDILSPVKTLEMTREFVRSEELKLYVASNGEVDLMVVPHGATLAEWKDNLLRLLDLEPDVIGIARAHSMLCESSIVSGRLGLLELVAAQVEEGTRVHFLGISLPPQEICALSEYRSSKSLLLGLDTALPWVLAERHIRIQERGLLYRRSDWHSDECGRYFDEEQVQIARYNALTLLRWSKEGEQYAYVPV